MNRVIVLLSFLFLTSTASAKADFRVSNLSDVLPKLSADELQMENAHEWWYFDFNCLEVNGKKPCKSLALFFFKASKLLHKEGSMLWVEYDAGENSYRKLIYFDEFLSPQVDLNSQTPFEYELGPARLKMHASSDYVEAIDINIGLQDFQLELDLQVEKYGVTPTGSYPNSEDGCYFRKRTDKKLKACVSFITPEFTAKGKITQKGKSYDFYGIGYHDHIWETDHLPNTHHQWHWGRMYSEEKTYLYAKVVPPKDYWGSLNFFSAWSDSPQPDYTTAQFKVDALSHKRSHMKGPLKLLSFRYPSHLKITTPQEELFIKTQESLLTLPMYSRNNSVLVSPEGKEYGLGWTEYYNMNNLYRRNMGVLEKILRFYFHNFFET